MKKKITLAVAAALIVIVAAAVGAFLFQRTRAALTDGGTGNVVRPLPVIIDLNNPGDGIYPVSIDREHITRLPDGCSITFELFSMDYYDGVELHQLKVGDSIEVKGSLMKVDSLSMEGPIVVNGGLENCGAEFVPVGGCVYRYCGWDDIATYTPLGKITLKVLDTVDFVDKGNVEQSMDGVFVPGKEVYEYLTTCNFGTFDQYSLRIRIDKGKVVEFYREYRP